MKMFKSRFTTQVIFIFALVIAVAACSGRRVISNFKGTSSAQAPGILTIRTGWVKDKSNAFDTELWFTNESKKAIAIPLGKVTCTRDGQNGSFRILSYDARFLELEPQEQRRFVGICNLGNEGKGNEWSFLFKDIAEQNNTGSVGRVLANQVVLKLSPAAVN